MEANFVLAIATLVAILAGPIIAVLMTRTIDRRAEKKKRRLDVFRDLMQTRGIRIDPQHVAALNVVELEFYSDLRVRSAFKDYITHLSAPMPSERAEMDRFFDQRSDLFTVLLSEIGKVLNYEFDKRDLERHSYVPQGWDTDQSLQRRNAQLLNAILSGQRPLPVGTFISNESPFPDPPKV